MFHFADLSIGGQEGADSFGRFLTTSMLPRIAELWKQGRVLYFVATNLLKDFDQAIIRSQRFDLKIFDQFVKSALRLYNEVAQVDGILEKIEAQGKIEAMRGLLEKTTRLSR